MKNIFFEKKKRFMIHKYQCGIKSTLKVITPTMNLRKQLHYIYTIKINKAIFKKMCMRMEQEDHHV